jgi:hypothetical protein
MDKKMMMEEMRRAKMNRVVAPTSAQMASSEKENIDAVYCNTSPAYVDLKQNYRVNGQPVSKG